MKAHNTRNAYALSKYTQYFISKYHVYYVNLISKLNSSYYWSFLFVCKAPLRNYLHINIYIYIYIKVKHHTTTSTSKETPSFFASSFRNVNGKVSHGIFPCPSSLFHPASILQDKEDMRNRNECQVSCMYFSFRHVSLPLVVSWAGTAWGGLIWNYASTKGCFSPPTPPLSQESGEKE